MSEPSRIVVPLFNRCVIFNTSERSLHGHPRPVEAPDGITRKSLALYFYARHPDPDDGSAGAHNTLFQKPNSDEHLDQAADRPRVMARVTREMSPPIVIRILRRLRNAMSGPRRRRP
jgi:hypothetical protein